MDAFRESYSCLKYLRTKVRNGKNGRDITTTLEVTSSVRRKNLQIKRHRLLVSYFFETFEAFGLFSSVFSHSRIKKSLGSNHYFSMRQLEKHRKSNQRTLFELFTPGAPHSLHCHLQLYKLGVYTVGAFCHFVLASRCALSQTFVLSLSPGVLLEMSIQDFGKELPWLKQLIHNYSGTQVWRLEPR